ncbi:MAG: hypothetical protein KIH62_004690 [Candidatus Kerfeldbacteria bacterium]|nr:hypothetical protein [Candidatus Kerfeldbacteria bacterium]
MEPLRRRRDHAVLIDRVPGERGRFTGVYSSSVIGAMFDAQRKRKPKGSLYATFTDIDDSLTRHGEEGVAQRIIDGERVLDRPIIAVTGNHFPWMRQRMERGEPFLRLPVLATSVGTEVWVLQDDGTYQRDEEYRALLEGLGYDRKQLAAGAAAYIEQAATAHPGWNVKFRHPDTDMNFLAGKDMSSDMEFEPTKITLRFSPSDPDFSLEACIQELVASSEAIQGQLVVGCRVPSSHPLFDIDIVPTTKGGALLYMTRRFEHMNGRPLHAVVAGDSGNDLDMLRTALRGDPAIEGRHIPALLDGYKAETRGFAEELRSLGNGKVGTFVRHTDAFGQADRLAYVGVEEKTGPQALLRILQKLQRVQK